MPSDAYNLSFDCLLKSDYTTQWDTVSNIEFERTDVYYDIHVPVAEHYLAEGIWHHNTGKSRGVLEKLFALALKYPGMRGLMIRKTRESMTQSTLVTMDRFVQPDPPIAPFHHESQEYRFPNDSVLVVGGIDKWSKLMSSEYDVIFVQEATELTEEEWEALTTRLRNGVMPYQQIIGDCNPDAPTHWLMQRCNRGASTYIESRHEDNPKVTPEYIATLDALTGVRLQRLRFGKWVAAEGQVYEEWDPAIHLIDRFDIPATWPRYIVVDFGYTNPFVCQWWARDPDGRFYRYREMYHSRRIVEDHAKQIRALSKGEVILAVVCDHDAEDRATLERHLGAPTLAAFKDISPGIQAVSTRLRTAGDGKPRLFFLRDSLVERDPQIIAAKHPACTEEEFGSYVWNLDGNRRKGELPIDAYNHGMDTTRYLVAAADLQTLTQKKKASFGG